MNPIHIAQVQALKKAVQAGVNPLPESMLACVRLYGSTGQPQRGKEILAAMEKLNYNPRVAWLTLVGKHALTYANEKHCLFCFQFAVICETRVTLFIHVFVRDWSD